MYTALLKMHAIPTPVYERVVFARETLLHVMIITHVLMTPVVMSMELPHVPIPPRSVIHPTHVPLMAVLVEPVFYKLSLVTIPIFALPTVVSLPMELLSVNSHPLHATTPIYVVLKHVLEEFV